MCLDTVTKTGLDKSGFGWKVFKVVEGKIFSDIFDIFCLHPMRPGKWHRAKRIKLHSYTTGFHIYTNKKGARHWYGPIRKVKYRKGHTLGKQDGDNIIVADEMMILPLERKGRVK